MKVAIEIVKSQFKKANKKLVMGIILLLLVIAIATVSVVKKTYQNGNRNSNRDTYISLSSIDKTNNFPIVQSRTYKSIKLLYDNYLYMNISKDDIYKITFSKRGKEIDYLIVNTNKEQNEDKLIFLQLIPDYISKKGYDSIEVSPIYGDGNYRLYSVKTLLNPNLSEIQADKVIDFKIDKIELAIDDEYMEKLESDRREAIELGILISDGEYLPATAYVDGEKFKTELRLKGDWTDHLIGNKSSLRIKVKDECIWGMSEFSIQNPYSRNGLGEYLIHEFFKQQGGVGLRYSFVDVVINGVYKGVYAVEEGFTKRAVESSLKREGVIIKRNENLLWESRAYYIQDEDMHENVADFAPYSSNKTLNSKKLYDYASYAINNLNMFVSGENIAADEVFDLDMYATYIAMLDIFGCAHGTLWHNMRYYFNPVTGLIEPIPFDEEINNEEWVAFNYNKIIKDQFNSNIILENAYFEKLYQQANQFSEFIIDQEENIEKYNTILARDLVNNFDLNLIYENVNIVLDSKENQGVDFYYEKISNSKTKIHIDNHNVFPVQIISMTVDGKDIEVLKDNEIEMDLNDKSIYVEYYLSNMPNEVYSEKVEKAPRKFYIAGHAYGAHKDQNDGLHQPFKDYFDEIANDQFIEFGVLLGDTVLQADTDTFLQLKDYMSLTKKPYYIASGNHDMTGGESLFTSHFGDLYFSFEKWDNLFIVLNPEKNWDISNQQLEFLRRSLENKKDYSNIFVFTHELFWLEMDSPLDHIVPNGWTEKDSHSNFWNDVFPLFKDYAHDVYFIAGDVGAWEGYNSVVYEQVENYHFIASGMGNYEADNIILISIFEETNEVAFDLVALNSYDRNALGKLEDYKKDRVNFIGEFYN